MYVDTVEIEPVMQALQQKCIVRYWSRALETIMRGTVRHLVKSPSDFNFYDPRGDVRDAYVRITLDTGFDVALLVSDLMTMVGNGEFAIGD